VEAEGRPLAPANCADCGLLIPTQVPTELEPWPEREGVPRLASINNFGYGGSNAHVIMEEYRAGQSTLQTEHATNGNGVANGYSDVVTNGDANGNGNGASNGHHSATSSEAGDAARSRVFVLSAKEERAARLMTTNLRDYLLSAKPEDENDFLDNLAYTLNHRRSKFPWVATFAGQSIEGLAKVIDSGKVKPAKTSKSPRLGFVYTGQGAQWWAMGRELIDVYPAYKSALLDCDAELKKLGTAWSVIGMSPWSEDWLILYLD